ncbi:MAG: T9SS type A sorting domain-containing protein [Bacteroidales bacterium]|jgi:hypothetical protein|nr:T9SS type A sorting domain-containing protein [Bacteroidales bacterium]
MTKIQENSLRRFITLVCFVMLSIVSVFSQASEELSLPSILLCDDEIDVIDLTDAAWGITPAGGSFSGDAISAAGEFDPVSAGVGVHTIIYTTTEGSEEFTITIVAVPTITFVNPLPILCANSDEIALATILDAAATAGGTFSGDNVVNGNFDPKTATIGANTVSYEVALHGCTKSDDVILPVNALPSATITYTYKNQAEQDEDGDDADFCAVGNAVATITGTTGGTFSSPTGLVFVSETTGEIDLEANKPTGTTLPSTSTHTIVYSFTGANTCQNTATTAITINGLPTVVLVADESALAVTCNGDTDGVIAVDATGGSGDYPYFCNTGGANWNATSGILPFAAKHKFTNVAPGAHYLCVKDSKGCKSPINTVEVTEPTKVTISVAATSLTALTCQGDETGVIALTAAGGNTGGYSYSNTGGATWQTTPTFSGLDARTYTMQAKDSKNCTSATQQVQITEPAPFDAGSIATTGDILCPGESVQTITNVTTPSNAGAVYQYSWQRTIGGVTVTVPNSNFQDWTPVVDLENNGTTNIEIVYTRVVEGETCPRNSGVSAGEWTITLKPTPPAPTVQSYIACPSSTISQTFAWSSLVKSMAAGATLIWYSADDDGSSIAGEPAEFGVQDYIDESYWVSQTVNGCESERTQVVVRISSAVEAPIVNNYEACALESGSTISLDTRVPVAGNKLWYTDATTAQSDNTGALGFPVAPTFDPTEAQTSSFWVRVRDAENCVSDPGEVLITVKALPTASISDDLSTLAVTCFGNHEGVIVVNASGGSGSGFEYSITDGALNDYGTANTFSNLGAGTYYVRVKDSESCESMSQSVPVHITQPDKFNAGTIASTGEDVCATSTPQLEITELTPASGGNGAITYEWYKTAALTGGIPTKIDGATAATYTPPVEDMVNTGTTNEYVQYMRYAKDAVCTQNYELSDGQWEVVVKPLPKIEISIDGNFAQSGTACAETEITFAADRADVAPYTWTYTQDGATVISGGEESDDYITLKWTTATDKNVEVQVFYAFTDTEGNGCATVAGVSDVQGIMELIINPLPTINIDIDDPNISANGEVCAETEITFIADRAGMAPYTWTYTQDGATVVAGGGANDRTITLKWSAAADKIVDVSVFYSFTDVNGNGCATLEGFTDVQATKELTVKALPEINIKDNANLAANGNQICAEAEVTFTTDAGMTGYAWNIDGGTVTAGSITGNTVTVKWETPGTKSVSVFYELTGGNGCGTVSGASDAIQQVIVNPLPEISISNNASLAANGNQICAEAEVTFTTDAGMANYVWSIDGGTVTAGSVNSNTVTVKWSNDTQSNQEKTVSLFYEFTGGNGCETKSGVSDAAQTVIVKPLPEIYINNNAALETNGNQICAEAEVTFITAAGMTNYLWSIDGGTVTAGSVNSNTVTVKWSNDTQIDQEKTVSIFYESTGGNGCESKSGVSDASQTVIVKPLPEITISNDASLAANGNQICAEAEVTFTTDAGMTGYVWNIDGGTVTAGATNQNSITVKWRNNTQSNQEKIVSVFYEFTGDNGCTTKSGVSNVLQTVIVKPLPEISISNDASLAQNGNQICAEAEVTFTTDDGMTGYEWSIDGGTVTAGSVNSNTVTVKWETPGTKSVSVFYELTGGNGCTTVSGASDASQEVIVKPLPEININDNANLAANGNQICAEAEVTFMTEAGMTGYEWSIDGGTVTGGAVNSNTVTVKWETPGTKTVSVFYETTGGNGCTTVSGASDASQQVIVNPLPEISISNDASLAANGNQLCAEAEVTFTTDAGMNNYVWSIDGGTVTGGAVNSNTVTVKWETPGTKSVSVFYELTGGNGCTTVSGASDASQQLIVNSLPEISISNDASLAANGNQICAEAEVTFTTDAGMNGYVWSIDGGTVTSGAVNSNTVTVKWSNDTQSNQEKTVSLFYETANSNGCATKSGVSDAAQTVIVKPLPRITMGNDANLAENGNEVCADAVVTFTTEEGMTGYVWNVGTDAVVIGANNRSSITVRWNSPGTKIVSVFYEFTGSNGCATQSGTSAATQEVILNPSLECNPLNAIILSQRNTNYGKNNGSVEIAGIYGTAPYQYAINGGAFQDSGLFENLAPGQYLLTVKDAENATHSIYVVISEGDVSDLSGIILSKIDSSPDSATGAVDVMGINGMAPYEYSIDSGVTFQSSGLFENLAAGDYVIIIRDALGDTFDLRVRINTIGDTELQGEIVNQENSDQNVPNGMVEVVGVNGTAPYQYAINGGAFQNSGLFENLAPGNYVVTVKDASGKTVDVPVTIGVRPPYSDLSGILLTKQNTIRGRATGRFEVAGRFGTRPYQYAVNGGAFQSSGLFENLAADDYLVVIKDAAGNTYEMIVRITESGDCVDVVVQKGNTTLVVNNNSATNGGYTFVSYEWFKAGFAIDDRNLGKNLGYFYDADNRRNPRNLDFGAEYYALVVDSQGVLYQTCPIYPEQEAEASITVYPTPAVRSSEFVNVKLDGFKWQETKITLYSVAGSLLSVTNATGDITPIPVPNVQGIYIVKILSGTQEIEKTIVRE